MTQTELRTWKHLVNRYDKQLVTRSDKLSSHDKSSESKPDIFFFKVDVNSCLVVKINLSKFDRCAK